MEETGADIVSGRAVDENMRSINGRYEESAQSITRSNVWNTQIEWMVFFKRDTLVNVGGYNEDIGVGSGTPWQACEGQDIVLRCIEDGAKAFYSPSVVGHHAELNTQSPDKSMREKGRLYAQGFGYVAGLHQYSFGFASYWIGRSVAGSLVSGAKANLPRARYFAGVALGRLRGYLDARRQRENSNSTVHG